MVLALPDYAELHCISSYTFLRGASQPEQLVDRAAALGYRALAITDECSLSGAVRAHRAARERGLTLIIGSEVRLLEGPRLLLLAADRDGYGDLCTLITRARRAADKGSYRLGRREVEGLGAGVLAVLLPDEEPALESARWLAGCFPGRAWVACSLLRGPHDAARLATVQALAAAARLPVVATGDVHMHVRGRRALQDTLTAIRLGTPLTECGQALYPNGERHLRPREALADIYPRELLQETMRVAQRCTFSLDQLRYEYPQEVVPAGVRALIEHELTLIADLQYAHYFLTVHDIVMATLRPRLRGVLSAARLGELKHGGLARVTGIVISRQRPGTASGVIFLTLEDETGHVNVVVWQRTAQAQRRPLLHARLLEVAGTVQREGAVIHLIAGRLTDRSAWLGDLLTPSRDFH